MKNWKWFGMILAAGCVGGTVMVCTPRAADPQPAEAGTVVVTDNAGKEQKLKAFTLVTGTRHLSWLAAPAPAKPEEEEKAPVKRTARPKPATGPEVLEFREENSTDFLNGILTFIPLDRLQSLDYDHDKETISAQVAVHEKGDGDKPVTSATLTGSTKYKGVNKLTIEAEVDKGDLGVAAVKFLGGVPKGIRGVRFPAPKPVAVAPAGRPAAVTVAGKEKGVVQKAVDLQPLYKLADGSERLLPTLMFKKTLKLDVGKIQMLRAAEGEEEWEVKLKDGEEQTLTLLRTVPLDGKTATLEGFVGRVPAGYKLFPTHTVAEIQFDEGKEEAK